MPKTVAPLSDTQIKNARPKDKDYTLTDGGGLYLLIKATGSKIWRLQYSIGGKRYLTSFGAYPAVGLAEAREKRTVYQKDISKGINPAEVKKQSKDANKRQEQSDQNTFGKIAADWLYIKKSGICETHYKKTIRYLEKDIYPVIGSKHIDEVTRADIMQIITKLDDNNAGVAARKCLSIVRMVYKYALTHSKALHNIAADIDTTAALRKREPQNFPFIKDTQELKELLLAIDDYQGEISTKYALKLMPLVFVRPANIRFMEWSEIDFKKAVWSIPAEKMKMKEPHIVPLSRQALQILEEVKQFNGSYRYVFVSPISTVRPLSENTLNFGLKRIGFGDKIVSHGFRHTASTFLNANKRAAGFDSDIIEACLAHKDTNKIRATYNHADYIEERRELMQWWADFLDKLKQA
jgi:integrase